MASKRRASDAVRRRAIRHTRKAAQFDGPTPACSFCGCDRIETLLAIQFEDLLERTKRTIIETHHPDGKDVTGNVIPLCLNCHAIESDAQQDLPRALRRPRTPAERASALHASDVRLLRRVIEICQERIELHEREREALMGASDDDPETG
jgi:hypothetical protein